ncbi:hypothetical protein FRC17_001658 [Serendipita sp. 399]|nr:hypothetical protein FRC17_001658 [Serendipita sp. 399]
MQVQETPSTTRALVSHQNSVIHEAPTRDDNLLYHPSGMDSYPDEKGLPYSYDGRPHLKRNPYRPFTKVWWNRAVEKGMWPRIIYGLIGFCLIGVWVGCMLMFAQNEVKAQRHNLQGDPQTRANRTANQFVMKGTLKIFDPVQRTLTVSWGLNYVDLDNSTLQPLGDQENASFPVNIYRDVRVIWERRPLDIFANQTIQSLGIYPPMLRIDNVTAPPVAVLGVHSWDGFDTDIDFTQAKEGDPWMQPLFGYPFDLWTGSIILAATDRGYAEAVNLTNTYAFPIDGAVLADSTLNWRITLKSNNTCNYGGEFEGCELHIDFSGRRPILVKFAAILAVVVNWTSTIGIFLLTCEAVIMRRVHILTETDILGVCFTALFALPSVRAILPGAPDFGAVLDLIGVIPNVSAGSFLYDFRLITLFRTDHHHLDLHDHDGNLQAENPEAKKGGIMDNYSEDHNALTLEKLNFRRSLFVGARTFVV